MATLGKCLIQMDHEDSPCWNSAYSPWRGTILMCGKHRILLTRKHGKATGRWLHRKFANSAITAGEEIADTNQMRYGIAGALP